VQLLNHCCSVRTGRDDLFEAGTQFWYVLMASRNFSGLYCMGIHTSKADCYNPAMTIGSAADSTYEYMLKQWVMSNHTQGVSGRALVAVCSGTGQRGLPNAVQPGRLGRHPLPSSDRRF
jgi:hypothetical protein